MNQARMVADASFTESLMKIAYVSRIRRSRASTGDAEERIEAWCAAIGADETEWTREDAEEHVRDEHSTYSWLLEPMIEQAGFEITHAAYSDDRFLAEYLLTAR